MSLSQMPFRNKSGFTLLEVVVAMTIVGLGVVTLLEIFSSGLRLGARSSARTEAISQGRQVLDEVLARRVVREGTEEGSVSEKARWKLQVDRVHEENSALTLSSNWELREVTLSMLGSQPGKGKSVELKTLRLVRKESP